MMFNHQSPTGYDGEDRNRRISSLVIGMDDPTNQGAKMYHQLNSLTMSLANKERKITEFDKQIRSLTTEYETTKSKMTTEKEKLDKALAKNKELRAMLNYVM